MRPGRLMGSILWASGCVGEKLTRTERVVVYRES